jgi:hypothetical protein
MRISCYIEEENAYRYPEPQQGTSRLKPYEEGMKVISDKPA